MCASVYFAAYGKVFLVRKNRGPDRGHLYAMKVLKKANIVQKKKTTEHTRTERQVLETIRQSPFLVTMHYAFQTQAKLHLVLGEKSLGLDLKEIKICNLIFFCRQITSVAENCSRIFTKEKSSRRTRSGSTSEKSSSPWNTYTRYYHDDDEKSS